MTDTQYSSACAFCGHALWQHAIRHKPSQNAAGYIYADAYMILACNIADCNCTQYERGLQLIQPRG